MIRIGYTPTLPDEGLPLVSPNQDKGRKSQEKCDEVAPGLIQRERAVRNVDDSWDQRHEA
jgi:hypothetical protein